MNSLYLILLIFFIHSMILSYLAFQKKKSSMKIANEMGIGYNLANLFDSYNKTKNITNPDEQITLYENEIPTKEMIRNIKKSGFKTIRFPVTWANFIDDSGNVDLIWMNRVKEVVNWIIESKMYCILNVHHDSDIGNWILEGKNSKNKFINLWKQIAETFQKFDEHLIFESMNEIKYNDNFDDEILFSLNQAFVDTIRNLSGLNYDRLLLISGATKNLDLNFPSPFKIPEDPANKLGISLHYYFPLEFSIEPIDNPWRIVDDQGVSYDIKPKKSWGTESDYSELLKNFENIKESYTNKGIVVILSEISVATNLKKEEKSIVEYLHAIFTFAKDYDGIVPCLWDTSNQNTGDMNYFNRGKNQWYNEKIKENFINISKGKYIKPSNYFFNTTFETTYSDKRDDFFMIINYKERTVLNIVFNADVVKDYISVIYFYIVTSDKKGNYVLFKIDGINGKKQYDGSYNYYFDASNTEFNYYVRIQIFSNLYINLNYLTVEFQESFTSFDYKSYKETL